MLKRLKKSNNIKIVSTGRYVPEKVMTNLDFEKIIDTSDEWIYSRTGIKARHYVNEESTVDLAYNAAMDAINKGNVDVTEIDMIICATITANHKTPSLANMIQGKLGLNDYEVIAFDVNAACSGFLYSLDIAAQMLNSGAYNKALIIGAEALSSVIDFEDRTTAVLFGDGAGAMIIENTDENKPAYFYSSSKSDVEDTLMVDKFIKMDGKKVYQFAVKIIPDSIKRVLDDSQLNLHEIDKIIPHQANMRIIETAAKLLECDLAKFFVNIEKYGNTSAASVIIALDEYLDTVEDKNDLKVLLVAFGGGFTWAASILTI